MSETKQPVVAIGVAVLLAAAVAFLARDSLVPVSAPVPSPASSINAPAARAIRHVPAGPLVVLTRDGTRRDLAVKSGKGQIIHFWATWCPPCREEMPGLVSYVAENRNDPHVEFLAVSVDQNWDVVDTWLKKEGIGGLPLALDPNGVTAERYGATGYPETFFIAPSGEIVRHLVGAADWTKPEARAFLAEFSRASAATSTPGPGSGTPGR